MTDLIPIQTGCRVGGADQHGAGDAGPLGQEGGGPPPGQAGHHAVV